MAEIDGSVLELVAEATLESGKWEWDFVVNHSTGSERLAVRSSQSIVPVLNDLADLGWRVVTTTVEQSAITSSRGFGEISTPVRTVYVLTRTRTDPGTPT